MKAVTTEEIRIAREILTDLLSIVKGKTPTESIAWTHSHNDNVPTREGQAAIALAERLADLREEATR